VESGGSLFGEAMYQLAFHNKVEDGDDTGQAGWEESNSLIRWGCLTNHRWFGTTTRQKKRRGRRSFLLRRQDNAADICESLDLLLYAMRDAIMRAIQPRNRCSTLPLSVYSLRSFESEVWTEPNSGKISACEFRFGVLIRFYTETKEVLLLGLNIAMFVKRWGWNRWNLQ